MVNDNDITFFKYKTKLLRNTAAQNNNTANRILKNATNAVPLKHLTSF